MGVQTWNENEVVAHLWVGGGLAGPQEVADLKAQGVTHILSVAAELDDTTLAAPFDLATLHIAWQDDGTPKPVADFLAADAWVRAALAANPQASFYVHCAAGVNRGPTMATFLLADLTGMSPDDAFTVLVQARPQVNGMRIAAYRQSVLAAIAALRQEPLPQFPTFRPDPPSTP